MKYPITCNVQRQMRVGLVANTARGLNPRDKAVKKLTWLATEADRLDEPTASAIMRDAARLAASFRGAQ